MTYRTNALGNVMSSIDGRIFTRVAPRIERRLKRRWARCRFTQWTALVAISMSAAVLTPFHFV